MKPGPTPSCTSGDCRTCRSRVVRMRFYFRHRAEIIPRNVAAKRNRKRRVAFNLSDEELDRRASEWLRRIR